MESTSVTSVIFMPGIEIRFPAADRFTALLGRYLEANKRNAGELVAKKAQDVSLQLYKVTRGLAPSANSIKADVRAKGWQVIRPGGQQKNWTWRKGDPIPPGKKGSNKKALNRLKAGVMARRIKARGYAATGWLPAVRKLGGKESAKGGLVQVANPKGSVTIEGMGTGSPRITVSNSTPGIAKLQKQHNIVRTAFNEASKDIVKYLRKKQAETAQQLKT